jgi:hypothetical protein
MSYCKENIINISRMSYVTGDFWNIFDLVELYFSKPQ